MSPQDPVVSAPFVAAFGQPTNLLWSMDQVFDVVVPAVDSLPKQGGLSDSCCIYRGWWGIPHVAEGGEVL